MFPDLFKRLKPLYGKLMDALWIEYQLAEPDRKREIEELVTFLAVKRLGVTVGEERIILQPPREKIISRGRYRMGDVIYPGITPYPFHIERNEFLRHMFILGPTGTGKSTLILNILIQFLADKIPFMVFDFKRNYRCLLESWFGKDIVVFTVGKRVAPVALNVLRSPPNVTTSEWIEALADIISVAYMLLQGARNVLKEALHKAIEQKKDRATIRDAYDYLVIELARSRRLSRRYGWLESSVRSLEELSKGIFGEYLNVIDGSPVENLFSFPVVFELEGLGMDQRKFFCLYFLQAISMMMKNSSQKREVFRHALIFDESHHIFPREKYGTELEIPSRLAREIREYGEAIIAATQQSDVSESLIANSGFKLVLRCDFPKDVQFASRLMQMDEKHFPKMPMGYCIARIPVRHLGPFLFRFSKQPIKDRYVSDSKVVETWERYSKRNWRLQKCLAEHEVTDQELEMLKDIVTHPISSITQRYKRLGWNSKTGNRVKDSILKMQLAYFEKVKIPKGQVKILSLSEKGQVFLYEKGMNVKWLKHGGAEHEYWKHTLKNKFEEIGWKVKEEVNVREGKRVDLLAEKKGKKVFIEVETGKSDVEGNIKKCLQQKGKVVVFFTRREVQDRYMELMERFSSKGVMFMNPHDFEEKMSVYS